MRTYVCQAVVLAALAYLGVAHVSHLKKIERYKNTVSQLLDVAIAADFMMRKERQRCASKSTAL